MSTICGLIHSDARPVDPHVLRTMLGAAMAGPYDAVGEWREEGAGLAHGALHVTVEDRRDAQPLTAGARHVLVADARLDDRTGLARALGYPRAEAAGLSDAALILAAYQKWGIECPKHLIGDFAFALWDPEGRQLFLARDPLGMRACYYRDGGNSFSFATTASQLLAATDEPATMNEAAVVAYIAAMPRRPDWSYYLGIHQLPPAHALLVRPGSASRVWRYWDVDPDHRIDYADEREYEEHFKEEFQRSVQARLRSAFPVGILLSGGLDSGSAAAMAGWLRERGDAGCRAIHTFSFAHEQMPQLDERGVSNHIVSRYGLIPHDIWADRAWPLKDYPCYGPHRDSPLIGAYQVLLEHTFEAARDSGVRLVFGGHRGDLLMGMGIFDYCTLFWSGAWRLLVRDLRVQQQRTSVSFPRAVRGAFWEPLRRSVWPRGRAEAVRLWLRRARRRRSGRPLEPRWVRPERWLAAEWEMTVNDPPPSLRGLDFARGQRYAAVNMPLHVEVSSWLARTCAQYGLTYADPWSDRRLVEFALAVPQRVLNRPGEHKRLTRQAMRGIMPEDARLNARKLSLEPLLDDALRRRSRAAVLELLDRPRAAAHGFVDAEELRSAYDAYLQGAKEPWLWYTLSLEMWLRRYWE